MIGANHCSRIFGKHDDDLFCSRYNANAYAALDMRERLGDSRIFMLRYEDLAMEPRTVGKRMFDFLGLPFNGKQEDFIQEYTG